MQQILFCVGMTLLGLVFGSFCGASIWRLRGRQLLDEDAQKRDLLAKKRSEKGLSNDEIDYLKELHDTQEGRRAELKVLRPIVKSISRDHSRCLHCGHELSWVDLIPVVSWLRTGGRCRYCQRAIGRFELIIELATGLLFALFSLYWINAHGLDMWPLLAAWIGVLVCMAILFGYDAKWFLLPDRIMIPAAIFAVIIAVYRIFQATNTLESFLSTLAAIGILAGLYFVLWVISRGAWIGFGDVKLGLVLGLLLGSWQLAFLTLFLSNFIGLLIVLPGLMTMRMTRQTHVPFGPLLSIGFFIALFYGVTLIDWYMAASLWLANCLVTLMV